jgi:hypothetical protein
MKYVMFLTVILGLTACKKDTRPITESESGRSYRVECIGGIEYWTRVNAHQGYMSVRVDPETMTFVRCESN